MLQMLIYSFSIAAVIASSTANILLFARSSFQSVPLCSHWGRCQCQPHLQGKCSHTCASTHRKQMACAYCQRQPEWLMCQALFCSVIKISPWWLGVQRHTEWPYFRLARSSLPTTWRVSSPLLRWLIWKKNQHSTGSGTLWRWYLTCLLTWALESVNSCCLWWDLGIMKNSNALTGLIQ